jgi:hypothetical protein
MVPKNANHHKTCINYKVQDVSIQSGYKNVNGIHVLWLDKYKEQVNMDKTI